MSSSLTTFQAVHARAVALHSFATTENTNAQEAVRLDILRSSLVLGVAAMDGYFTDRFLESFTAFVKQNRKTPALLKMLTDAGVNASVAIDLLTMQRPYRRLRTLITDYLENYTTQKTSVIDGLYLAYGIVGLTTNACGIAKRKKLAGRISAAAARRNAIVHDGDLNAHDRSRVVDGKTFRKHLEDITLYVTSCETLINNVVPLP